eukprot:CAMPEP_0178994416 /NCGR_PEP_ID=MMETSP0795-20121207/7258_1 /TAXON_ID=88552 /ORGANISM="Amoebophrya sp., Strain Ameob2" /LENGTH=1623 /DNA_ID=CAMNT_0020686607 /DNA_START=138 /DNA_END=5012 /DNA_ORIENTATION=+
MRAEGTSFVPSSAADEGAGSNEASNYRSLPAPRKTSAAKARSPRDGAKKMTPRGGSSSPRDGATNMTNLQGLREDVASGKVKLKLTTPRGGNAGTVGASPEKTKVLIERSTNKSSGILSTNSTSQNEADRPRSMSRSPPGRIVAQARLHQRQQASREYRHPEVRQLQSLQDPLLDHPDSSLVDLAKSHQSRVTRERILAERAHPLAGGGEGSASALTLGSGTSVLVGEDISVKEDNKKRVLLLEDVDLSKMGLFSLAGFEFQKVQSLNLADNQLREALPVLDLPLLKKLDVSGNLLSSTRNLLLCCSLEELSFRQNKVEKLEHLETLTELRYLDLRGNCLTSYMALRPLSYNTQLSILLLAEEEGEGGGASIGRGNEKVLQVENYWNRVANFCGPHLLWIDDHKLFRHKSFIKAEQDGVRHTWLRPFFHDLEAPSGKFHGLGRATVVGTDSHNQGWGTLRKELTAGQSPFKTPAEEEAVRDLKQREKLGHGVGAREKRQRASGVHQHDLARRAVGGPRAGGMFAEMEKQKRLRRNLSQRSGRHHKQIESQRNLGNVRTADKSPYRVRHADPIVDAENARLGKTLDLNNEYNRRDAAAGRPAGGHGRVLVSQIKQYREQMTREQRKEYAQEAVGKGKKGATSASLQRPRGRGPEERRQGRLAASQTAKVHHATLVNWMTQLRGSVGAEHHSMTYEWSGKDRETQTSKEALDENYDDSVDSRGYNDCELRNDAYDPCLRVMATTEQGRFDAHAQQFAAGARSPVSVRVLAQEVIGGGEGDEGGEAVDNRRRQLHAFDDLIEFEIQRKVRPQRDAFYQFGPPKREQDDADRAARRRQLSPGGAASAAAEKASKKTLKRVEIKDRDPSTVAVQGAPVEQRRETEQDKKKVSPPGSPRAAASAGGTATASSALATPKESIASTPIVLVSHDGETVSAARVVPLGAEEGVGTVTEAVLELDLSSPRGGGTLSQTKYKGLSVQEAISKRKQELEGRGYGVISTAGMMSGGVDGGGSVIDGGRSGVAARASGFSSTSFRGEPETTAPEYHKSIYYGGGGASSNDKITSSGQAALSGLSSVAGGASSGGPGVAALTQLFQSKAGGGMYAPPSPEAAHAGSSGASPKGSAKGSAKGSPPRVPLKGTTSSKGSPPPAPLPPPGGLSGGLTVPKISGLMGGGEAAAAIGRTIAPMRASQAEAAPPAEEAARVSGGFSAPSEQRTTVTTASVSGSKTASVSRSSDQKTSAKAAKRKSSAESLPKAAKAGAESSAAAKDKEAPPSAAPAPTPAAPKPKAAKAEAPSTEAPAGPAASSSLKAAPAPKPQTSKAAAAPSSEAPLGPTGEGGSGLKAAPAPKPRTSKAGAARASSGGAQKSSASTGAALFYNDAVAATPGARVNQKSASPFDTNAGAMFEPPRIRMSSSEQEPQVPDWKYDFRKDERPAPVSSSSSQSHSHSQSQSYDEVAFLDDTSGAVVSVSVSAQGSRRQSKSDRWAEVEERGGEINCNNSLKIETEEQELAAGTRREGSESMSKRSRSSSSSASTARHKLKNRSKSHRRGEGDEGSKKRKQGKKKLSPGKVIEKYRRILKQREEGGQTEMKNEEDEEDERLPSSERFEEALLRKEALLRAMSGAEE